MPITIVDADYQRLRRAARTGRARSKDVQALIKAIEDLAPGKAKALVPERGETAARLRARLAYAARAAGVRLRVVIAENRVVFTPRAGAAGRSRGGASDRKRLVQQKAVQLGKGGRRSITAEEILKALHDDGVKFDVARPATMVGAVLRAMKEFERTGRNTFKYRS
jgi:hypothetical protein